MKHSIWKGQEKHLIIIIGKTLLSQLQIVTYISYFIKIKLSWKRQNPENKRNDFRRYYLWKNNNNKNEESKKIRSNNNLNKFVIFFKF